MKLLCASELCTGCAACTAVCSRHAITLVDTGRTFQAEIDPAACVNCGLCQQVCPQNHPPLRYLPQAWYQGWALDAAIRSRASSGGISAAVAAAFLRQGGCVAACVFDAGRFDFRILEGADQLVQMAGSNYVKSTAESVYVPIKKRLQHGQHVLFIGLPCQTAAILKFVGPKLSDHLYTVDLICHGTPSVKLLKQFLAQYRLSLQDVHELRFRRKSVYGISCDQTGLSIPGICDRYTLAFFGSLSFTEGCYHCPYAGLLRAADLTLGDSWGSNLPQEERRQGISLVLVQSEKGQALLSAAEVQLEEVDLDHAQECNHPLVRAETPPRTRSRFFACLSSGIRFNHAVFLSMPWACIKQQVKSLLLRLGAIHPPL